MSTISVTYGFLPGRGSGNSPHVADLPEGEVVTDLVGLLRGDEEWPGRGRHPHGCDAAASVLAILEIKLKGIAVNVCLQCPYVAGRIGELLRCP